MTTDLKASPHIPNRFMMSKERFAGYGPTPISTATTPSVSRLVEVLPAGIFYGDQDKVVPPSQNKVVHERYQAAGLESSLHMIKGAGHGGMPFSDAERYGLVKAFVDRHIKQVKQ